MEINNKRKLLKAPPNLTLNVKKQSEPAKNGVSSCNLSRIADKTQRTEFKQEESILNDLGAFLNSKRDQDHSDASNDSKYQNQPFHHHNYTPDTKHHLQLEKIYEQYEKALEILTNQAQSKTSPAYSFFKAYQILTYLINVIKSQTQKDLKYELAQNILLNYWKVANDLFMAEHLSSNPDHPKTHSRKYSIQHRERQRIVQNFRTVFLVLEDMLSRLQVKIHKLTVLALILAKEYFRQKDMGMALEWCQKGFKHCPKFKNTSILLKLHYMKSQIYRQIHANQPQYEQIKKCIFFLKALSQSTTQNKDFSHELMKNLLNRRDQLKNTLEGINSNESYNFRYNKSTEKTSSNGSEMQKSASLNKFRKRSISFSKLKTLKEDDKPNQNAFQFNLKKSLHKEMASSTAYQTLNNQAKKQSLKLDINRKTKLKKKGQTLTIWEKNSQKMTFEKKIAKELEKASVGVKSGQNQNRMLELMSRRPNDKRQVNLELKDEGYRVNKMAAKDNDNSQDDTKEKNKNQLVGSTSNIAKTQNIKEQTNQGELEQEKQKQASSSNNIKNKLVITTKSENQLIKYISIIQNDFLSKYFSKSLKTSIKQGLEDIEGDYLDRDDFAQESDLFNQFMNKDTLGKDEIHMTKLKGKITHDYDENPVEEDSNDSADSYTKNVMVLEEEDEEKLIFPNLVSTEQKKNTIATLYGIIQEIDLQIKRKKFPLSGRWSNQRKSETNNGFRFIMEIRFNDELLKTELHFPLHNDNEQLQPQAEPSAQKFQEQFYLWMYESVPNIESNMKSSSVPIEDGQMVKEMLRRQSINSGIGSYLIEKIITNLQLKRNFHFGYSSLAQKQIKEENDNENWERESIFEWREKNFQYLKESFVNSHSKNDLHSLDWRFGTTTSKQQIFNKRNDDLAEDMKSVKHFFIELQKLSSIQNNQNVTSSTEQKLQIQYLMNRYNIDNSQSFDKQFMNSYVMYNERSKMMKLMKMQLLNQSQVDEGESLVNVSGLSDEESLNVLNFSQNIEQMLMFDERSITKIEYMRQAGARISNSYFPKFKYIQLISRNFLTEKASNKKVKARNLPEGKQIKVQGLTARNIDEFVIKIIGLQPAEKQNRKKVSVRKSQIIQLQQNLNHNNFLKEVLKSKSGFSPAEQCMEPSAQSIKKSQMILKTVGKMSSKSKESALMSMEKVSVEEAATSLKRKSLQEKELKRKISKSTMVRILKKALIQPDYKKSTLLMTYFDSLSIKSFCKVMGWHPNYIKLTCFRLKSIYVQEEQSLSYYYLFELQEKEARTRMHKFIIGDREIRRLLTELEWHSDKHHQDTRMEDKENISNWIVHRAIRQTKTLPQNKKVQISANDSNDEVLSDQNKNPHYLESVTSSKLKTKGSIFESQFQNFKGDSPHIKSLLSLAPTDFELKFTEESLTQVMKLITPHIVIKKDYLYTSVCINSTDPIFYLMNKFTVENDSLAEIALNQSQKTPSSSQSCQELSAHNIALSENLSKTNYSKAQTLHPCKSEDFYKSNYSKDNDKNYFLSTQIKAKQILCQKSLVLQISQNFAKNLQRAKKNHKHPHNFKKNLNIPNNQSPHTGSYQLHTKNQTLFSILTIIKISQSNYFTIKLYIPKFQRSYSLTLDKSIINYLEIHHLAHIFAQNEEAQQIIQTLENIQHLTQVEGNQRLNSNEANGQFLGGSANFHHEKTHLLDKLSHILFQQDLSKQKVYWKNLLELVQIQEKCTDDKVYLILKISNFHGFIKDSSFLQFFQKDGKMYMIEMSINQNSSSSQYFPKQSYLQSLPGNKIKRGILTGKQIKNSLASKKAKQSHANQPGNLIDAESINCHNQEFVKMPSIYESKAEAYTLYVQIFKIYQETDDNKMFRLVANHSLSRNFAKTTQKNEDEIDSEMLGANDSVNQVIPEGGNRSQRQSEVQFSDFKSNNRLIRASTFRHTLKSTQKSINSQTGQNPQKAPGKYTNCFSRNKRIKSSYKLVNNHEQMNPDFSSNQISKINFSFYLSELSGLFKYIDENYSEEFNEEFFVLSQMSTAFKMLGTMIVEQFKTVREENAAKAAEVTRRSTQKKVNQLRKNYETEGTNLFKRSVTKKGTNRLSGAESLREKQVGFEQIVSQKGNQVEVGQQRSEKGSCKQRRKSTGKHGYTVQELFLEYRNQKSFKQKILSRMKDFKQKVDTMHQKAVNMQGNDYSDPIKEDSHSHLSSRGKQLEASIQQSSRINHQRQRFISLHSRSANSGFVDLHILSSEKQPQLSTLFYSYDSLLFLISNTKTFEIYMMAIKVEEEHPFSFIQVLEDKRELQCIRNRLFRFYRNLLLLAK